MRWMVALFSALLVGAVAGSWLKNLPGFVIIAYQKTSYEMRLWVAIVIILSLFTLLLFAVIFTRSLLTSASRVKDWQGDRHWKRARKQTTKGMLAFIEGRWQLAEKIMIDAAKKSEVKLINYLVAARAAQHQNAQERRDSYLRLASQSEPKAKIAVGLTQAQLQLESGQIEQALAILSDLNAQYANHPFVLKLLNETHQKLQDWQAIINGLPNIKKHGLFEDKKIKQIEEQAVQGVLEQSWQSGGATELLSTWKKLPTSSQKNQACILYYMKLLLASSQDDEAEKLIKPLLKKSLNSQMIDCYSRINASDGSKQLTFLESQLNSHPNEAGKLYLALGKLAFNQSLWGKARFYLERALRVDASAEGYFIMAESLKKLGDEELSQECYRQGLTFAIALSVPVLNSGKPERKIILGDEPQVKLQASAYSIAKFKKI